MSTELPPATGRSVFSVFGFGSSHYSSEDDFNSPLETAPESFDASNTLTAVTKKKKSVPVSDPAETPLTSDTVRKVKVSLPDQSALVLQTFSQSTKRPVSPFTAHLHHGGSNLRRYSTSQEEADEMVNSNEVLDHFGSTISQTTCKLTRAGASSTNIYTNPRCSADSSQDDTWSRFTGAASTPILTRVKSSPHLSLLPSFMGSPKKEPHLSSGVVSQFVRRNQSHNDLLEIAEYQPGDKEITPAGVPAASSVTTTITSERASSVDPMPGTSNLYSTQKSGFSILSKTRQFGSWLTKASEGDKVEVTKKDLNVLAPNSF